jgi:hypothetical protein
VTHPLLMVCHQISERSIQVFAKKTSNCKENSRVIAKTKHMFHSWMEGLEFRQLYNLNNSDFCLYNWIIVMLGRRDFVM